MPNYIAMIHEPGGCDYTMECGTDVLELKAKSMKEAINELEEIIFRYEDPEYEESEGCYTGEHELSKATIFEVSDKVKINLGSWYKKFEKYKKKLENEEEELAELEELKRLSVKYGDRLTGGGTQ